MFILHAQAHFLFLSFIFTFFFQKNSCLAPDKEAHLDPLQDISTAVFAPYNAKNRNRKQDSFPFKSYCWPNRSYHEYCNVFRCDVNFPKTQFLRKSVLDVPHCFSEGRARILPQEGPRVEKDTRLPPILPVASCSSTEPPWLSLAKKKAKAWSEMPQVVQ
uniref:Uncharacterized protein n=1 Tax=Pseudonaja textilis TaxID=8673 RepID=A0A670ZXB0_PSETE